MDFMRWHTELKDVYKRQTLSTSHEQEFNEIVRLQDFAMQNFTISDEIKKKVLERRERERIRFGL